MADCDVSDVAELLRVDHEVAVVLWLDQRLDSSGRVALPFFNFSMTTCFNLQLT